jgi:hypothetical protein
MIELTQKHLVSFEAKKVELEAFRKGSFDRSYQKALLVNSDRKSEKFDLYLKNLRVEDRLEDDKTYEQIILLEKAIKEAQRQIKLADEINQAIVLTGDLYQ